MNIREVELAIIRGLESYLSTENRTCKLVLANTNTVAPDYPYVAYTSIQAVVEDNGSYGVEEDGTRIKQYDSVFSFTIQSNDVDESIRLAIKAMRWFSTVGTVYLSDNGIAVKRVGSVTNRDNLISAEYEYRNGFDVTLTLLDIIDEEEFKATGYIEQADVINV